MGKRTNSALHGDVLIKTAAWREERVKARDGRRSRGERSGTALPEGSGVSVSVVTLDSALPFLEIQKETTGRVRVEVSTKDSSQHRFY